MTQSNTPRAADDAFEHGDSAYRNHGCRCETCTEGNRLRSLEWRRRHGIQPRERGRTHGVRSTYTHGCRCDLCREAEAIYRRDHRRSSSAPQEGNVTKRITTAIRFDPALHEALKETAQELGVGVNWLVNKLCEEGLQRIDLTGFTLVRSGS